MMFAPLSDIHFVSQGQQLISFGQPDRSTRRKSVDVEVYCDSSNGSEGSGSVRLHENLLVRTKAFIADRVDEACEGAVDKAVGLGPDVVSLLWDSSFCARSSFRSENAV